MSLILLLNISKFQICSKCISRKSQKAARAGTPGFRPPEVLLKFEHQTTSVDLWAAGVVFLCLLSRTYPFFRAQDDMHALAEITAIFGLDSVRSAAEQYGKHFLCSEDVPPTDLKEMCLKLAARQGGPNLITDEAIDLLTKLLKLKILCFKKFWRLKGMALFFYQSLRPVNLLEKKSLLNLEA